MEIQIHQSNEQLNRMGPPEIDPQIYIDSFDKGEKVIPQIPYYINVLC